MSVNTGNKDEVAMRSYNPDLTKVPPDFRQLLEDYSKIAPDDVVAHVNQVRKEAFDITPYPCIGQFKFMALTLLHHPRYSDLLKRLKSGQTFLDIGCCFAQDMRKLVADGVPSAQLHGLEIEGALVEVGYDLFRDRGSLQSEFHIGDALAAADSSHDPFRSLAGQIDIVNASAFIHLFPWDEQVAACARIAGFTRGPGALVVGRQTGSLAAGDYPALNPGTFAWRHDIASFQRLWDEAGARTGTKWKVTGTLDLEGIVPVPDGTKYDPKDLPVWWEPNIRRMLFEVERIE